MITYLGQLKKKLVVYEIDSFIGIDIEFRLWLPTSVS